LETADIVECLDFTLLDHGASEAQLAEFLARANAARVGAVCVFAEHATLVRERLDAGIQLAVVAGGFPVGSAGVEEIRAAVAAAAAADVNEIDVVLEPRQAEDFPNEEDLARLDAMREAAGECVLKVILETPLLEERPMRAAARMALAAGADFIKTCTGKRGACSDDAAAIFAYEVMRHERAFGEKRGVKLSGGIRTREDVERFTTLVNEQDPSIISTGASRFRIGASSLLDSL
tara:strand:+ start:1158 stop:1859 length:702 start_codon:yes stop_codon:yes gene_type:complete